MQLAFHERLALNDKKRHLVQIDVTSDTVKYHMNGELLAATRHGSDASFGDWFHLGFFHWDEQYSAAIMKVELESIA